MKNAVLTLAEVLALPEGARVWVDANPATYRDEPPCMHRVVRGENRRLGDEFEVELAEVGADSPERFWPIYDEGDIDYGVDFRAWSIPQPPTQEEMDANPWEVDWTGDM